MNYIATPANFHFTWYVRLLFWFQRWRYGRELEPVRLWGRIPRAFLAMSAMYHALDRRSSPIEPALRSLVQVRVSQINWCAFCIDLNSALGAGRGVSEEKLRALPHFADSNLFSEPEKAAVTYAEAMTDSARRGDPALIARLQQHFSDNAIVELTALIAYPVFGLLLSPIIAAAAMSFSSVSVVTNALRLNRVRL